MGAKGDGGSDAADAPGAGKADGKRALVDADDWKDEPGRKTICEYHKDGLPQDVCETKEVDDLEYFSEYWKERKGGKLLSEYHKEGAPYIGDSSDWDGHRSRREGPAGGRPAEKAAPAARPRPAPPGRRAAAGGTETEETGPRALPPLERLLDVPSVELAAYALFRSLIGRGIRIPLKREGIVDMDIIVKDKDVLLNTNEMTLELPRLAIWRFIFAYKGEPVLEYGRGVKNNIKVHRWRMFKLLLRMWWRGRQKSKQVQ